MNAEINLQATVGDLAAAGTGDNARQVDHYAAGALLMLCVSLTALVYTWAWRNADAVLPAGLESLATPFQVLPRSVTSATAQHTALSTADTTDTRTVAETPSDDTSPAGAPMASATMADRLIDEAAAAMARSERTAHPAAELDERERLSAVPAEASPTTAAVLDARVSEFAVSAVLPPAVDRTASQPPAIPQTTDTPPHASQAGAKQAAISRPDAGQSAAPLRAGDWPGLWVLDSADRLLPPSLHDVWPDRNDLRWSARAADVAAGPMHRESGSVSADGEAAATAAESVPKPSPRPVGNASALAARPPVQAPPLPTTADAARSDTAEAVSAAPIRERRTGRALGRTERAPVTDRQQLELAKIATFAARLRFPRGSARLTPAVTRQLDRIFEILFIYQETHVTVRVAAREESERAASDRALARARAEHMVDYLTDRGLDPARFRIEIDVTGRAADAAQQTRILARALR